MKRTSLPLRRREFITLLGGAAAWPLVARAQGERVHRVVFWLGGTSPDSEEGKRLSAAFRDTLRGFGWVDGANLRIEVQWVADLPTADSMRRTAAELVSLKPDVIVTTGAPILAALHRETKTIPIVFTMVTDPVSDGFVQHLARPGGNITGFTIFDHSFAGKWVEMLKEVVPGMARVAVMQNPDHPAWGAYLRAVGTAAQRVGVEVTPAPAHHPAEIEAALGAFAGSANDGLVVLPSPVGTRHAAVIAQAALRRRLPSIYGMANYPANGGLMSYGISTAQAYRDAAGYVDRILRGASPSGLPVQAATKFAMTINLSTAKALRLDIPPTLLARADEVIE